jgi:hypothetical protein
MRRHYHKRRFNIDKDAGCTIKTSFKNEKWKGDFLPMAKQIFAFFMVFFFCSTLAFAATQTNQKDQKRNQKQSGSCSIIELDNGQFQLLVAEQTRTRKPPTQDRKNDGSCKTSLTEDEGLIISADQTQTRDRKSQKDPKRDGSCG